jgi:hypothetical protein
LSECSKDAELGESKKRMRAMFTQLLMWKKTLARLWVEEGGLSLLKFFYLRANFLPDRVFLQERKASFVLKLLKMLTNG